MECSRIVGNAEDHSRSGSNESGWTSYLVSSSGRRNKIGDRGDGNSEDHGHTTNNQKYGRKGNAPSGAADGSESDDSLASDASSGPSHRQTFHGSNEEILGTGHSKSGTSRCPPKEKHCRQVKQRDAARMRLGEGESFFKAKTGASDAQSST